MNSLKNKVSLIGFLGKDPEIKSLESGNTLAKFSIATNETYLNGQGEKVSNTTWHPIVAWGKLAEICGQILKKGSEVVIQGKLINRSYEDSTGVKRYITEIQLNEMLLVGSKSSSKPEELESTLVDNEPASAEI